MNKHLSNNVIRLLFLCFLMFMLDSCRLFRRRESEQAIVVPPRQKERINTNSKTTNTIISTARSYTGVPYLAGGADRRGMDCSGLLFCVYNQLGYKIPRISLKQAEFGKKVEIEDLRPGDWVFFVTNKGNVANINHAGLVTELRSNKEVMFIHASSSKGIREDNLYSTYWISCFAKASRPF